MDARPLAVRQILRTWWPLAISWVLMTAELPMLAAIVARRPDPEINLAAWGLTFPLALILASPIMAMLPASTTLCKDWASYHTVRRYMAILATAMTAIHGLLAFTLLFDLYLGKVIAAPAELWEPARISLQVMLPWTLSLAIRRFNYGVLIRFDHSRAVTVGTLVRLGVDLLVLSVFAFLPGVSGIQVAAITITCGVAGEAIYAAGG